MNKYIVIEKYGSYIYHIEEFQNKEDALAIYLLKKNEKVSFPTIKEVELFEKIYNP